MKYFELWLDESGDFEYDAEKVKKGFNCSFVGGILTEREVLRKKLTTFWKKNIFIAAKIMINRTLFHLPVK